MDGLLTSSLPPMVNVSVRVTFSPTDRDGCASSSLETPSFLITMLRSSTLPVLESV